MAVYNTNEPTIATEDYLVGVQASNVIPSYASFDEMAFHVAEASEADFNALMMECGVIELAYMEENHAEMVYESGKIKEITDKAVDTFKNMWSRVQEMFERALSTIQSKSQEFRKKVLSKVNKDFLQKRVDNLKPDKNFGTTFKLENIDKESDAMLGAIDDADKEISDASTAAFQRYKKGETGTDDLDATIKASVKKCIGMLCHGYGSASDTSAIVKVVKGRLRGKTFAVNGAWVKANYKTILAEVTDFPTTKRKLKKDYNEVKKRFNKTIKDCKKANDGGMFEANAYTKTIAGYKQLRQINTYVEQAVISCLNERESFNRSVLIKLIGAKPAKGDKKAVGESTTVDGVQALFENW
jgi:hypothetical protein